MSVRRWLSVLLVAFAVAGCQPEDDEQREYPVLLDEGTYHFSFGAIDPADEARFAAVTARLDRTVGELTFTGSDGSSQTLTFTPRPRSEWVTDCWTMKDHALDELADLGPAPLVVETLTFTTPMVYAKCCSNWLVVADAYDDEGPHLRFTLDE